MGVEGIDSSEVSSPASARVEEGVAAPGPPSSGSVAERRDNGRFPPGEVGGEDDRDVTGLVLPAAADATEESPEPAGLDDRPPVGLETFPILGILFPVNPLFSDVL